MKVFKQALSVVCTIALFLCMFSVTNKILMRKESIVQYHQFFDDNRTYDVIFLGTSHVLDGISPLDLFHMYGITSFNYAMHGNSIASSYYQLRELSKTYKNKLPKAVILDVYIYSHNLHRSWDCFKISKNKWDMVNALLKDNIIEYMFPFTLYHSRWNEALKEIDIHKNTLFGANLIYGVNPLEKEIITNRNDKKEFDPFYMDYLEKMRALCEELKIHLILINIPYSYQPDNQRKANYIYDYAQKHDLTYVNYMNEDTGIDFNIDFCNSGHLNPVGMRIMTNEIGKLLQQTTTLHDRRNEPIAKRWNEEYQDYIYYRINRLKGLKNTNEFLMACNDPDLTVRIEVNNKILTDKTKWLLIERLEKIKGNTIKKSFDKVTHTKADNKNQKCDISAVVFRRDSKKEVFRAAFSSSEKMK